MTLFERDDRLGGHANTIAVRAAGGREVALDTGFIVHNRRTCPTLLRLFSELVLPRHPLMTARVTSLIHLRGIKLALRGVARVPRPPHPPQEHVG